MILIAKEHYVSSNTVARVLRSTEIKNRKKYLPEVIGIDEFKSLKDVDASMNVNITDLESKYDILQDILSLDKDFKYTYEFYQKFLIAIDNKDVALLYNIINSSSDVCPYFFKVNLKSLKKRIHYVINSIKYSYTNAVVEGKNNMIKVFKRVSFGFRSYRNMIARILLRERFEIK